MQGLGEALKKNVPFVLTFLGIIVALFLIALLLEKLAQKKRGVNEKIFTTRKVAMIGMFSAIATILMMIEIPMTLFAPGFYKLDFSELPILVGTFAFGPAAGVMMEFVKIVLKLLIKGTSTAFVGELANFAVGCSFILTASVIYNFKKTKKAAIFACIGGTIVLTVFGTAFNAVYLLPAFAKLYGMPLGDILAMGAEINPLCKPNSIVSFVVACVAPLNLIKGIANSVIVLLIYKPLSPILKGDLKRAKEKKVVVKAEN
ncbi:MAG: ECF transporter S component [Lachnospiraceae bacterium]|nr:ECF transporter S component [Lachnospiraceae bacterium]